MANFFSKPKGRRELGRGFTLLEILLVMGILAILSGALFIYYRNFMRGAELESVGAAIISDLKSARGRSAAGQGDLKWGVHFVNSASDYYEIFSSPTDYSNALKTVLSTTTLPGLVSFSDPASSQNKDIIFSKITATTTAASITITSEGEERTVNITAEGAVY